MNIDGSSLIEPGVGAAAGQPTLESTSPPSIAAVATFSDHGRQHRHNDDGLTPLVWGGLVVTAVIALLTWQLL